ncbi:MAG: Gfo/Idh/MocA family oxidoreductase [Pirellulaceae bacterium]|nr:Gfo/Idh/MocA family oxidoreductase [Pirellulaceae bacterium]
MSKQNQPPTCSRRRFLQSTSALGAGLLAVNPTLGQGPQGANDRLSIGLIGTGHRGGYHLRWIGSLAEKHNAQITAVCDVWKPNRESVAAGVKKKWGKTPLQTTRYAEVLASKDVDAVVIATPDFSHTPIMIAALEAGKDVYVEKPMSLDVDQASRAVDLARAKNAVVQVGTQRRSEGPFRGAAKLIATGVLGKITRVSSEYNFNHARWDRDYDDCKKADVDWDAFLMDLPKREFDPRLLRRWHLYRDFTNGLPGLWMTHYVDTVNMLLGTTYPSRAVALGGTYVWKEDREFCDTFRAVLEYPEEVLFAWGMGLANEAGRYWTIHGTQGTIDLEAFMLLRAGGKNTKIKDRKIEAEPSDSHMGNWLSCLRSRRRPTADIEMGHQHSVGTIMAAVARDSGQRQTYDAKRRAIVPG